jgi:serine/threonine-protein kinase
MSQPSPCPAGADRNLLFGILALQMDFIRRDDLIAAMNAWVLDKTKSLGQILLAQQALRPEKHELLEALVRAHLEMHGQDPQRSLAALSAVGPVRGDLQQMADADVQASLVHVSAGSRAPDATGPYVPPATLPPQARFQVLRPHARGGLGEVFVARDVELKREVALKEIQERHADNPEARARFLLEAEVTGGLEHPGIVPVYGLGAYGDGRPFYAMRFVRGDSLKDAITAFHREEQTLPASERTLRLRQLLGRFVDVCNAVAYAHSRGVLHRDLKPGNVMLGKYGETLVVDWGLAKVQDRPDAEASEAPLRPSLSGDSTMTQTGAALGTPGYMSPEQAAGKLEHLGPHSDVYSLGATLYCLLTGRAPFTGEDEGQVLVRVQRGDFPPPREVKRQVAPALEAVCLRAMALQPAERYGTPRELAEEIERWLADEPVRAYREPAATRLARWARRHRPLVAGAAALLLTVVVALAVGLVLLGQAGARTEQQRRLAEAHFVEARRQRDLARRAVDEYFVHVSENTLLKSPLPGLQPLRKQLLESALKYYQEFVREGGDDPEPQAELAQAYLRVGRISREMGHSMDGMNAFQRAQGLYQALANADPQNVSVRAGLAQSYRFLGLTKMTTNGAQASALFQQAITLGKELVQSNPDVPEFQSDLAHSYDNLGITQLINGQMAASRHSFEMAITTWEHLLHKHPRKDFLVELGTVYSELGATLWCTGQMPEGQKASQEAVNLYQKLVNEHAAEPVLQNGLGFALDNLGASYFYAGQPARAVEIYQKAVSIAQRVSRENPAVVQFLERAVVHHIDLGHALLHVGRDAEAQRCFEEALERGKKLPPGTPAFFSYASIHRGFGKILRKQGKTAETLGAFQKAVQIAEANPDEGVLNKPLTTYELACARALCSAVIGEGKAELTPAEQEAKRRYAVQAMEALRQAAKEGWENVAWMRKDPDLHALQGRDDFEKLLAGLEKKP